MGTMTGEREQNVMCLRVTLHTIVHNADWIQSKCQFNWHTFRYICLTTTVLYLIK